MRLLQNLSIRSKMLLLAVTSAGVALVLAAIAVSINDVQILRQSKIEQLESQARMLSFNATAVLTFQDRGAAEELLASLVLQPTVECACFRDATGHILSEYRIDNDQAALPELAEDGYRFTSRGHLEIQQSVHDGDEVVGTLHLRANMSDYYHQLRQQCKAVALMMVVALAVSASLAFFLQKAISRPIERLAKAAKAISNQRDYSIRVDDESNNETGQLCKAFNRMLDEVEASKDALVQANDQLEQHVQDRTRQLTEEIQEKERVQADLVRAKERAEAANKAKSEFLANMSHEIRTPLNGVLGFADLLLKGADAGQEEVRRDYLQTIKSSGEHLLTLLNDILDISKIEAGQFTVEHITCSPHEIINHVVSLMRAQAQRKGLDLTYQWSGDVPEFITTDPARLRQLLTNLIGNAVKFTEQGSVCIRAQADRRRNRFQVDVTDTGVGIAENKLAEVFDPFQQADNSVTRRFGGTGLGLAICRHLAQALGGTLEVESVLGKGSTFSLEIDAGSLAEVPMQPTPQSDALATASTPTCHPTNIPPHTKVLLVEDGPTNRKLIRAILEGAGISVDSAENGQVGVQIAEQHRFDLILMDMQMPVMDGYSAARRLREQGIDTPIIALTAHAMKGDESKCRGAGCDGYLTKPISPDRLMAGISQQLSATPCHNSCEDTPDGARANDTRRTTRIVSRLPMDQPIFRELVGEFADLVTELIDSMRDALDGERFEELAEIAHTLKGTGGTAGFDEFTDPARTIEQLANTRQAEPIESLLLTISELADSIEVPEFESGRTKA